MIHDSFFELACDYFIWDEERGLSLFLIKLDDRSFHVRHGIDNQFNEPALIDVTALGSVVKSHPLQLEQGAHTYLGIFRGSS